ncbi:Yju2 splicing factor-like protein [Thalictrum thalictroides]|uniref:Splicing factor YJU2 n=1 Tax=Thalictrum thalictroides TaxID=46969 RepID=A0A7J6V6D4_THATH|nr:Yju2 splicing factor-like protein [Thalictrum thalictroides]
MGERKVLNKRIPPDFNPSRLPRIKQPKNQQINVRNMLPMSIRCNSCGNYIYKGTKFNMRKEVVLGETYLGIQIFRFYLKCTHCSAEMTMKTDPKNSDYVVDYGASRNYEPWRAKDEEADKEKRKRDSEEMGDAMKFLENRTLDSKREMDKLANLYELKSMKSRHARVSSEKSLESLPRKAEEKEKKLEPEDEALIKAIFQVSMASLLPYRGQLSQEGKYEALVKANYPGRRAVIRKIEDYDSDEDEDEDEELHIPTGNGETNNHQAKRRKVSTDLGNPTDFLTRKSIFYSSKDKGSDTAQASNKSKFIVKRVSRAPVDNSSAKEQKQEKQANANDASTPLQALVQNYDSDED